MTLPDFTIKRLFLVLGPALALLTALAAQTQGMSIEASATLAVTILCVVWWVFEPIPIPATSLLPLGLLPLLGVLNQTQIAQAYGHPLVLLLLGGFILSTAMEKSGAHRRIALTMVRAFGGTSSRRLVLGFMAAAATLSMWISNTATTLMLLPVALAVIQASSDKHLVKPLLLGTAYAASLGGIGTPIGTPPNVIFMGIYNSTTGQEISFLTWMGWGIPVVLIFLPVMGIWLTRNLTHAGHVELPPVGRWRNEEIRVLTIFVVTALLWVTRKEPFGGWSQLLHIQNANDATVALLAVVSMFIVPNGNGGRLLDWDTANKIPWGMLILFGGGIAIAEGFIASGLSTSIGNALSGLANLHTLVMIFFVAISVTFMTEATSNTATTSILMPILAAAALGAAIDPRLLMVPAAMSASCAFMLPVATAPNVIMFSTGELSVKDMVREGFALNIFGAAIISLCIFLLLS